MAILQVHIHERPIQEMKIVCPACKEPTKIALMHTGYGGTFQAYLRDLDPKSKIGLYEPHLTPYGKTHPNRNNSTLGHKGRQTKK